MEGYVIVFIIIAGLVLWPIALLIFSQLLRLSQYFCKSAFKKYYNTKKIFYLRVLTLFIQFFIYSLPLLIISIVSKQFFEKIAESALLLAIIPFIFGILNDFLVIQVIGRPLILPPKKFLKSLNSFYWIVEDLSNNNNALKEATKKYYNSNFIIMSSNIMSSSIVFIFGFYVIALIY